MGKLLENAKARQKVIKVLKKYGFAISVVSYLVGLSWMVALPHQALSASNYFSENQLLPGLVETYFSLNHYTQSIFNNLQGRCSSGQMQVKEKVKHEFYKLAFDVYEQNFDVPSKFINGSNVYGVFRSPRASGVESIILNVPLRKDCNSSGSLALMLGIANYFREQTYWAKDIIFLVTEYELYGIQAWLDGYFNENTPGIHAENLYGRGGSIQAAITLDFPANFINYIDILYVGSNGLLPNLDFIHLVTRIANMEGVPSKFQYQTHLSQDRDEYLPSLETLIRMMAMQASGYPTGNHGMFFKYRIEAVTLQGRNKLAGSVKKEVEFESIGRMIEGIFRSVNNMLEHFHQSFFLYVLPNTYTYISIGMYMPPLGFLVLPLAIYLIILWIEIFQLDSDKSVEKEHVIVTMSALLDGSVIQHILLSYILSVLCYFGLPYYFNNIDQYSPSNYQLFCVLLIPCYGAVVIVIMIQHFSDTVKHSLKFFGLLHLGVLIVVASIFNFSAAFVIASFYTPLAVSLSIQSGKLRKLFQVFFSVFSSPPVLLCIICMDSEISLEDFDMSTLFVKILPKWRNLIIDAHVNPLLPIWTKDLFYFAVLPMWITLSSIP